MANVQYAKNSPYFQTPLFGKFHDLAVLPVIPPLANDVIFTINKTYQFRPDLLAADLYGDANLWWVFAIRNPSIIKDSIFDMRIGTRIYLPKKATLNSVMG